VLFVELVLDDLQNPFSRFIIVVVYWDVCYFLKVFEGLSLKMFLFTAG